MWIVVCSNRLNPVNIVLRQCRIAYEKKGHVDIEVSSPRRSRGLRYWDLLSWFLPFILVDHAVFAIDDLFIALLSVTAANTRRRSPVSQMLKDNISGGQAQQQSQPKNQNNRIVNASKQW